MFFGKEEEEGEGEGGVDDDVLFCFATDKKLWMDTTLPGYIGGIAEMVMCA